MDGATRDAIQDNASPNDSSPASTPSMRQRRRAVPAACERCHARKVKCSGGQPCNGCRLAKRESDCKYPRRQRLVKVDQEYIDRLVEENQRLKDWPKDDPTSMNLSSAKRPTATTDTQGAGPSIEEHPWFLNINTTYAPILVAEASDAGFGTRFRQAISSTSHSHIPRLAYPSDERLLQIAEMHCPFPPQSRARILISVALRYVHSQYHIVRRSEVLRSLDQVTKDPGLVGSVTKSKLWALLAIGEAYSSRMIPRDQDYPGMLFFSRATAILHIVSERPNLDAVELQLLLSLYSAILNRRHAAYVLAGSAVRLAVVMGLHLNVPRGQLEDVSVREHRIRLWWTAYTFDRVFSMNLGNPVAAPDDVIDVDRPSNSEALPSEDFTNTEYHCSRLSLAQIAGRIVQTIYVRKSTNDPPSATLAQRVQEILKSLHDWRENLPANLSLDHSSTERRDAATLSLQLSFNQCLLVATRPILLYTLRAQIAARGGALEDEAGVTGSALSIGEACSKCARQSLHLLTECWVDGSFPTFDFFYPQHLFSAGTVIAISSLIKSNDKANEDKDHLDSAIEILGQLAGAGHWASREFCQQFEAMKAAMNDLYTQSGETSRPSMQPIDSTNTVNSIQNSARLPGMPYMSLPGPSLQEFLTPSNLDLQLIDDTLFSDIPQNLYWTDTSPENHQR